LKFIYSLCKIRSILNLQGDYREFIAKFLPEADTISKNRLENYLLTFELLMKLGWHLQTCLGVANALLEHPELIVRSICFSNFNRRNP